MTRHRWIAFWFGTCLSVLAACSSDDTSGAGGNGAGSSTGGSTSTGGTSSGGTGGSSTGGSSTGGSSTGGTSAGDSEPASMNGMTAAHNQARANVDPPASTPIPPLEWSATVASVAQAYADKCQFNHSGGDYGENLFASTGDSTPQDVVSSWISEAADYSYASNTCSGICGHYTQVVWADSKRLGCGMANCSQNSPFGGGAWQLWVCNYDPAGNYVGERPY